MDCIVHDVAKNLTRLSDFDSQVALVVKILPAKAGDTRDTVWAPGSGRSPGARHGNPLQYSFWRIPQIDRSLAGYSPLGHKDSDMTEVT